MFQRLDVRGSGPPACEIGTRVHSTGPRTADGKARVRRNALLFGDYATIVEPHATVRKLCDQLRRTGDAEDVNRLAGYFGTPSIELGDGVVDRLLGVLVKAGDHHDKSELLAIATRILDADSEWKHRVVWGTLVRLPY